ncbi:MAG: hypothetical protein ABII18_04000 [bacterium]|nr:hypothetical protein [bacterium]MBU1919061.1 hypothetical protein [bacterium]
MKETIITLLKLSDIDKQIHQKRDDQTEIPDENQVLTAEIINIENQISTKKVELNDLEILKKELTNSIQLKTEWITTRDESINDLRTQKEYQAAQKEISAAKKEIKEKENQLAIIGPKIDTLSTESLTLMEKGEPRVAELRSKIQENNKIVSGVDTELDVLNNARNELVSHIEEKKYLKHYNHILRKAIPAISLLENGICTECGTRVLPQTINLLKVGQSMQYCTRCKRILYLHEMLEEAKVTEQP